MHYIYLQDSNIEDKLEIQPCMAKLWISKTKSKKIPKLNSKFIFPFEFPFPPLIFKG
jgi:hypothetical protein